MREQYGVAAAAAVIATVYLLLAIGLFAWRVKVVSVDARPTRSTRNRRSDEPAADRENSADTLAKQIATGNAAQARTLALSADPAKQLTPVQLVMLAALTGFVAGRKS
jgi:hypothetical protein